MSFLLSDKNKAREQEALLRKQLVSTPNDPTVNYLLADLFLREGAPPNGPRYKEARAALDRSLADQPDSAEAKTAQVQPFHSHAHLHFDGPPNFTPRAHIGFDIDLNADLSLTVSWSASGFDNETEGGSGTVVTAWRRTLD